MLYCTNCGLETGGYAAVCPHCNEVANRKSRDPLGLATRITAGVFICGIPALATYLAFEHYTDSTPIWVLIASFLAATCCVVIGSFVAKTAETPKDLVSGSSIALALPLIAAVITMYFESGDHPTNDSSASSDVTSHYSGSKSSLPVPAREVLGFVSHGETESVSDSIESPCGLDAYMGSDSFPGSIDVSDADLGAHTVVWTIPTCNSGQRMGGVFAFRISQDGAHIQEKTGNTFRLWSD